MKIYKEIFTPSETILLTALSKKEIISTHRIVKHYSRITSLSKASFSRAVKRLVEFGIMEKITSGNYNTKHKRMVDVDELGIFIIIPMRSSILEIEKN